MKYKGTGQGCKGMLGTSEEYARKHDRRLRRLAELGKPPEQRVSLKKDNYQSRRAQRIRDTASPDWLGEAPVIALYRARDALNEQEGHPEDPWEVDHIRPICQGGTHTIDNMRLIRHSKNIKEKRRSEEQIEFLQKLYKVMRKQP